ncbi:MAG TPA: hypothetical protein ENI76_10780 [Ignavibacteria bacterium]|nr:hypothetical protein [Ignavibacteria bacterium]
MNEEAGVNVGMDMDFNASEEAIDIPFLAEGVYIAKIQSVMYKTDISLLEITWVLENNGGTYPGTEFSIDGAKVKQNIWLPKAGDEKEMSANGKMTKRQSKLNSLKRFCETLGVSGNTPEEINDAILSGSWGGVTGRITVKVKEDDYGIKEEVRKVESLDS